MNRTWPAKPEAGHCYEEYVIAVLKKIHVPGTVKDGIVTVYGYRTDVDYI